MSDCPLCGSDGGELVWRGQKLRVIRAQEALYPAWFRVVWNGHVKEFSQLSAEDRMHCLEVVNTIERVLIDRLAPTKINLAQFGNMVPHLHWHVIARYAGDAHFPNPAWGPPARAIDDAQTRRVMDAVAQTTAHLSQVLRAEFAPFAV